MSLQGLRDEMPYVNGEHLPVVTFGDEVRIWTFAGGRANAMLAGALCKAGASLRTMDNFGITLIGISKGALAAALDKITEEDCQAPVDARMESELKFGICLPKNLVVDVLRERLSDFDALHQSLQRSRKWIHVFD